MNVDSWRAFPTVRENRSMVVAFDRFVLEDERNRVTFNKCARVQIRYDCSEHRMPNSTQLAHLEQLEDGLLAALDLETVAYLLVGRLTYDGIRELVFQLESYDGFRPPVGRWMISNPGGNIEVSEHEGWAFVDDFISPTEDDETYLADQETIERLIEHGSDPKKMHQIDYGFEGPIASVRLLEKILNSRGYECTVDGTHPARLNASKQMLLDVMEISQETIRNRSTAIENAVDFLGWGAGVEN